MRSTPDKGGDPPIRVIRPKSLNISSAANIKGHWLDVNSNSDEEGRNGKFMKVIDGQNRQNWKMKGPTPR
jgi:hypothetical protein